LKSPLRYRGNSDYTFGYDDRLNVTPPNSNSSEASIDELDDMVLFDDTLISG